MATDEADSDNKFSPEDYGEEDKENNEADVEFEFEMKSDSDSEISAAAGLPPVGYHRAHRESYAEVASEQHPGGCRLGGANPLCEKITAPCRAPGRVYYNTFRMPMNT